LIACHPVRSPPLYRINYPGTILNNTRAIRKVTSGELLTKQAMRKNVIIYRNMYILKLLLNVVTAGIDALVSENKVLYACVKEVCHL
jgi:hypothetical protein